MNAALLEPVPFWYKRDKAGLNFFAAFAELFELVLDEKGAVISGHSCPFVHDAAGEILHFLKVFSERGSLGEKLCDYPSQSEADLALCNKLAFWTGKDSALMDSLFRQSGLIRAKWDEKHFGDVRMFTLKPKVPKHSI